MNQFAAGVAGAFILTMLPGCSNSVPKCSDDKTFALVRQIVINQMDQVVGTARFAGVEEYKGSKGLSETDIQDNLKIELPRASAFDEKIKKYSCEAKLVAGGKVELPIKYGSQLDDKGEHIVFVGGIVLRDLLMVGSALMEGIKEKRAKAIPQPQQATPSPQPAQVTLPSTNTSALVGKNASSALDAPTLKEKFKLLLGDELDGFRGRLETSSAITQEGEWLVGEGGKPHLFSMEEAAFAVNTKTSEIFAIMLTEGKNLKWFGATVVTNLPAPLQTWYKERGGS